MPLRDALRFSEDLFSLPPAPPRAPPIPEMYSRGQTYFWRAADKSRPAFFVYCCRYDRLGIASAPLSQHLACLLRTARYFTEALCSKNAAWATIGASWLPMRASPGLLMGYDSPARGPALRRRRRADCAAMRGFRCISAGSALLHHFTPAI